MTRAETLLWRYLKANRLDGIGFRRQAPIGNYTVDFVCFSAKLVIELDGEPHEFEERQRADRRRDAVLSADGFRVLRFTNEQVMSHLEGVVEAIRAATAVGASGSPPSPSLPHKGGGSFQAASTEVNNISKTRGIQP